MVEYPLDISFMCSVALEGGLMRHRDILPEFSDDCLLLIHEWNRALCKTILKPKYMNRVGKLGETIVDTNSPAAIAQMVDGHGVPYRSYYYAKRFLDAYNFVTSKYNGKGMNVVDFGRGLSPWPHILTQKSPKIHVFTFDTPITDEIYSETTEKLGLRTPNFGKMPDAADYDQDAYVSLGTYVYLPYKEQVENLTEAQKNFKNLFVELDTYQSSANIKKPLPVKAWTLNKVEKVLGKDGWHLNSLVDDTLGKIQNNKTIIAARAATERFLVR